MHSEESAAHRGFEEMCQEFDVLFRDYHSALFHFACSLTQNSGEAEDLYQETWLRVVQHLHKVRSTLNPKAWLFTIMNNLHRDMLRKRRVRNSFLQRRKGSLLSKQPIPQFLSGSRMDDASDKLEREDLGRMIFQAVSRLPDRQRRVFVLKEIEEFKLAEISIILRIPLGTVKSLLFRALKRLRKDLSEYNPGCIFLEQRGKNEV